MQISRCGVQALALFLLIPPAHSTSPSIQDEILENGAGRFAVDIPGCSQAAANIQSVQVEDLTIDTRETTDGVDWNFRTYAPGDAHYGKATFRCRVEQNSKELLQWWYDASWGKDVRKNITVVIRDRSGNDARRYHLNECFPLKFDPGDYSPSSATRIESITVKIGRVEFDDSGSPNAAQTQGQTGPQGRSSGLGDGPPQTVLAKQRFRPSFRIEVTGPAGGKHDDQAWETSTGGALCLEVAPASTDSSQAPMAAPRSASISEVTLRGPMTKSRKWIGLALNDTLQNRAGRFDLTIVEIAKDGSSQKSYTYLNCFLTRYAYPQLSADCTGNLYEEVSLKPERLQLK